MAVTSIRPNDVLGDIDAIKRLIANQDAAMDEVGKQVQFLSSVWDSDAQREFDAAFVQTKKEIAGFNQALSQYADMMKMSVKNFEAADKALGTSLKNVG
ncbi:MAG: WXG100 family type VII secretion target [Synergistaceae bacterium]|jgi:WXG100 family type VII secretion target|nr:WXG100 family type VII secretion target [Synergistaceae bacterium]